MFTVMKTAHEGKTKYRVLAQEEIEAYRDIFKVFDVGGKGYLTAEDFGRVGGLLNSTTENNVDICKQFDANGDGKVTLDELLSAVACMNQRTASDMELSHIFKLLDKNSDGNLDKEELGQLMTSLGGHLSQKDVDEMMLRFDKDMDGRLQYEEFVKMLVS